MQHNVYSIMRRLIKPGALTPAEFAEIRQHTVIGSEIIRKVEMFVGANSFLRQARDITEFHHECWDGTGYPHGLKGEEIPLCARLMAIADIYDSLTSSRSYKPPYSHSKAFDIITNGDGRTNPGHFSPSILKAFRAVQPEWSTIAARFADGSPQQEFKEEII